MKRFVRSLTRVANRASNDSDQIMNNEYALENNFAALQTTVRKSLMGRHKPQSAQRVYSHPPHVQRRSQPVKRPIVQGTSVLMARPNPYRNFALPSHLSGAPKRIYRSPATQRMYEDVLDGYEEYLRCPTRGGILEYESQIDPYLHVGTFADDEMSQTATGALTGVYTFY